MTNPTGGGSRPRQGEPQPREPKPRRLGFVLTLVGLLTVAALYLAIAVSALLR